MPFTIDANGRVEGLDPIYGDRGLLAGFQTPEGQQFDYLDTRGGPIHDWLHTNVGAANYYIHPSGKIDVLTGAAGGNFATGQQAAMAQNRWLLTTPGNGIGVQTAAQRSAVRWPGTTSPGNSQRNTAIRSISQRLATEQDPAKRQALYGQRNQAVRQPVQNPARAPTSAAPVQRPTQAMRQGSSWSYAPPGIPAPANQYNYTPTAGGSWQVDPPGIDPDPMSEQYSSALNMPPSLDEQQRALAGYTTFAGLA